jgi:hypothetical protein
MSDEMEISRHTTRALSGPLSSSLSRKLVTPRELVSELERLSIHFPRTDMDERKWRELFRTFVEDFQHLSLAEVTFGCRRYRQNPANKFFPTPGQLLEACKDPYEDNDPRSRRPAFRAGSDDLVPARDRRDALELIERTRKKWNFAPTDERMDLDDREPVTYVPMPPGRARELLGALKRTLEMHGKEIEPECESALARG